MTLAQRRQFSLALVAFLVVLAVAWACYRPALSGDFELDDRSNLSALATVEDAASALDFSLTGKAGPLGRPLALATFALQADQWEQGARAFLAVNVLIHMVNALLVLLCAYQLALLAAIGRHTAIWVAVATASLWVTMPLLASSSLLVVQRMTTLSAMFALLGLAGYLAARRRLPDRPVAALAGMSVSLTLGTLLAVLSKESGALLPAFVLVLEATLLTRPESIRVRNWRAWQAVFLGLPVVMVVGYLVTVIDYPDALVASRGFNAWERLLTESRILWSYVGKALVGLPGKLGVYQAPPAVSRSLLEPLTLLASVAWLGLAAAAMIWRRRFPLFALAVLWYLAGHLVESTVVSLELYFEHRNYLPVIGPVFALCASLAMAKREFRRLAALIVPAFLLVNAFFLFGVASLRGDPALSANYWALKYPDSVRAMTTRASHELGEWGPAAALKTLDEFMAEHPQHAYLRIQALNIRCRVWPDQDHGEVIRALNAELPAVTFTYSAGRMLSELFTAVKSGACRGVSAQTVGMLAERLLSNPRYQDNGIYKRFHHKLMAGIYQHLGDYPATLRSLESAIEYGSSEELDMMMVTSLAGAGEYARAKAYIDEARQSPPASPLRAIAWRRNLYNLRQYVVELERYARGEEPPDAGAEVGDP